MSDVTLGLALGLLLVFFGAMLGRTWGRWHGFAAGLEAGRDLTLEKYCVAIIIRGGKHDGLEGVAHIHTGMAQLHGELFYVNGEIENGYAVLVEEGGDDGASR
jgi:hypothetical protein